MQDLPNAIDALGEWLQQQGDRRMALFLDFDGTVSPIVARPDEAEFSAAMHGLIEQLAGVCSVAFVTGRDLEDIRQRVGIATLDYAGSHGFSIRMADGFCAEFGQRYLTHLDEAEVRLRTCLQHVADVMVERKRVAIAVHTRGASEQAAKMAEACVADAVRDQPDLISKRGKKVLEVRPAMEWHKGSVVRWMLQRWDRDRGPHVPMFIGDDVTDEDAFCELADYGMTVLVGSHGRKTCARYRLADVEEVRLFLERLLSQLKN